MPKACVCRLKVVNCVMFTKWKIDIPNMENYRFGEDKELYRLPFDRNGRSYGIRKIKMQYPSRWVINGKTWSKEQLRAHLIDDDEPIQLFKTDKLPY